MMDVNVITPEYDACHLSFAPVSQETPCLGAVEIQNKIIPLQRAYNFGVSTNI